MEISPVYWTILGEIGAVLIGVLIAVIVVILKDRKKLKEYSDYLKEVIKKLKKKLQESEDKQSQERVLALLTAVIEHVHAQYNAQYGNDITPAGEEGSNDAQPSVEKFVFIAGFQTMTAQLSALENSNEAEVTWEKIKNELTPLFNNYLQPILSQQNVSEAPAADDLHAQLESANKRINNLEKFKQLYFELQDKLSKSIVDIETLNQTISELSDGSEHYESIQIAIEKNKALYLEMGQMIGMDKERHHENVANTMDYSEAIINERKDEIKRLKSQIAQQFEDIWSLQSRLGNSEGEPTPEALSAGIETISRNLKDAEMCIETMDMEIQTLTSEISNLKNQLKEQGSTDNAAASSEHKQAIEAKEQMIARFAQESKELMSCITGLEDGNLEQSNRIKELEEKYAKLEAEYSTMEGKYLDVMSQSS
ncbi:MAG: hypothetical protein KZQ64_10435 [gamma proteobacterium symbiont of Bathyaustriella thionipta]|nr:hypothetical protein [gamma proteobacterium symbiont of Bathyaustriella thionipta]MCU7948936.1 hypothetical protein [gamma proteobacterium symbiont of Bathyaustriella thionipta]MCU7953789.1 hypothetical protein [gamma proteobacterium symbiont of Bathyaustriella thionipta]MCU7955463.1 hypothetical protein [gamma proteobacterium symbiont of Bathyaustriella thionipta]MCU7966416.1 hypothetical protein [gamma proteobacterium symbiont of Bathyaustriella thionipta]